MAPAAPGRSRLYAVSGYAAHHPCVTPGGVRVDHILGLFRLVDGNPPGRRHVRYDHNVPSASLVEAQRAGAVVIGEDPGVFETDRRTRVIAGIGTDPWFEHGPYAPIPPEDYRRLA